MCQDVNLSKDDLNCRMETEMEQKGLFLFLLIIYELYFIS